MSHARPCTCDRFRPGPYRPGDCRLCWLAAHDPRYRTLWGVTGPVTGSGLAAPAATVRFGPCGGYADAAAVPGPERARLGLDHARDWRYCPRPDSPFAGQPVCPCDQCGRCPHRAAEVVEGWGVDPVAVPHPPPPPPITRHLAYHVCPVAGNGVWRRGVDQLRLRRHLFAGRRVCAVVTGPMRRGKPTLDTPDMVREYAGDVFDEVVSVPNDPELREVATWGPLWDRVLPHAADRDHLFYAHAKGVTRATDPGNMTHVWASLQYHVCLDYPALVAAELARHPIAGCFKKVGAAFGRGMGRWHYSGTFYWLRADDFKRRYASVPCPRVWYGTEAWPGTAYEAAEAGCLFFEGTAARVDPYCPTKWESDIRPEFAKWQEQHRP